MSARILVIEDELGIRENLREMLEAEGFTVFEADTGSAGIAQALTDPPDLVVCDVMMPGHDGFEVLSELRRHEFTQQLPFLFLTARADRGSLRRGMELGAEDYLTKPFTRLELLAAVKIRLQRSESLAASYRRQLDSLRSMLARALPHELLTPLNGILGLSGILVAEYETVHRGEVLDIARDIAHSGEAIHNLVRRFLGYAEMEMALLDPALADRLRRSNCPSPQSLLEKFIQPGTAPQITTSRPGSPAIVPEHLEILLCEILCDARGFEQAHLATHDGIWTLDLDLIPSPTSASSDLTRALIATAAKVYDASVERGSGNRVILTIPAFAAQAPT